LINIFEIILEFQLLSSLNKNIIDDEDDDDDDDKEVFIRDLSSRI